jgi:hypothetical protein
MKTSIVIKQSKNDVVVVVETFKAHTQNAIPEVQNKVFLRKGQFTFGDASFEEVVKIYSDEKIAKNWFERNAYVTIFSTYKKSNKKTINTISKIDFDKATKALDIKLPDLTFAKKAIYVIQ